MADLSKSELALLELFATTDTVFEDGPAFARNHKCPASVALARIYRDYIKTKAILQSQAEVYGRG